MKSIQRDKCWGRRLVASGGDFGIRYATARQRSFVKTALAALPFVALVAFAAFAIITR